LKLLPPCLITTGLGKKHLPVTGHYPPTLTLSSHWQQPCLQLETYLNHPCYQNSTSLECSVKELGTYYILSGAV
uniref:Uncharacterized protein n=1 Tax=Anas zonorhyncha TaxID=75864 RepID=A0A8B9V5I5_9AVES